MSMARLRALSSPVLFVVPVASDDRTTCHAEVRSIFVRLPHNRAWLRAKRRHGSAVCDSHDVVLCCGHSRWPQPSWSIVDQGHQGTKADSHRSGQETVSPASEGRTLVRHSEKPLICQVAHSLCCKSWPSRSRQLSCTQRPTPTQWEKKLRGASLWSLSSSDEFATAASEFEPSSSVSRAQHVNHASWSFESIQQSSRVRWSSAVKSLVAASGSPTSSSGLHKANGNMEHLPRWHGTSRCPANSTRTDKSNTWHEARWR